MSGLTMETVSKISLKDCTGISSDSREIQSGMIFVAVRGETQDGHDYLSQVIDRGAAGIVGERPLNSDTTTVPYYWVPDSREALAYLASRYYGEPSREMQVIGITGTSGKTTVTYLLESIFLEQGKKVGVIGTVNVRFQGQVLTSTHTTPDPIQLQKCLHEMKNAGCDTVLMEVSSHALKQKRVYGVYFDGVIFTNLSQEHLDYHETMEDYFLSKKVLFTNLLEESERVGKRPVAAINAQDSYGKKMLKAVGSVLKKKSIGSCRFHKLKWDSGGISGVMGAVRVESSLIGKFNAENIAVAVQLCELMHVDPVIIQHGIENLKGVPGRMEIIREHGLNVVVDYAHKPDALEKVLKTLRPLCAGRLTTVVGCGGDRDRSKRPMMGKIAAQYSDQIILTADNPRRERVRDIIQQMMEGVPSDSLGRVACVEDRRAAIIAAVQQSHRGDWILIAGKGHESYQVWFENGVERRTLFDDREVAREALSKKRDT